MKLTKYQQDTLRRAARILENQIRETDPLTSPDLVKDYLANNLAPKDAEVFGVIFLDNRHRMICFEEMFNGTINSAAVYLREVVKRALEHNAAALILAHNHPSGESKPSDTDIRLTKKIVDACGLLDIRVLDHIVVGHGVSTSLQEAGMM